MTCNLPGIIKTDPEPIELSFQLNPLRRQREDGTCPRRVDRSSSRKRNAAGVRASLSGNDK